MNITLQFDELLQQRKAPKTKTKQPVSLDTLDGFLKEAYRIVSLVLGYPPIFHAC